MTENETSGRVDFGALRVPEEEKAPLVRALFDSVATRYDLMNDLMSAGIHRSWKAAMVAWLKPHPGQVLLDVAGGTGDIALRALPRLAPGGAASVPSVVVCDTSQTMLEIGRARALDEGILAGIEWVCADAERLPVADRSVDLYSFRIVPLLGRIVTGEPEAYSYLVESIRRFPRQSELCEMIGRAGLDQVRFRNLTGGVAALHSAWRL